IVIVNYNGGALLEAAVRSALAQDVRRGAEDAFPVVVVDNASADGSLARLAAFGGHITVIASPGNTGYAGGHHLAFGRFPDAAPCCCAGTPCARRADSTTASSATATTSSCACASTCSATRPGTHPRRASRTTSPPPPANRSTSSRRTTSSATATG